MWECVCGRQKERELGNEDKNLPKKSCVEVNEDNSRRHKNFSSRLKVKYFFLLFHTHSLALSHTLSHSHSLSHTLSFNADEFELKTKLKASRFNSRDYQQFLFPSVA